MGILTWIIFGLIAGAIAKAIHPGKDPGGWLVTIIIGIVGAFIGGAIGTYVLGWGDVDSFWSQEVGYWPLVVQSYYYLFIVCSPKSKFNNN